MNTLIQIWVKCLIAGFMVLALTGVATAQSTTLGRTVTNVASLTYAGENGTDVTVVTPPATFTVVAQPTESTIEFFRYSPNSPNAINVQINGSDYFPNDPNSGAGTSGPTNPVGPAKNGGSLIDTSGPIPLTEAGLYATGELIFVRVIDPGQNGNPNAIESVMITIIASTGDEVTLTLYESGPDTGEFWGYIPSTRDPTPVNDNELTTGPETQLTATYIDSFDSTDVSTDTALLDPYCRVFNALTGDLVDGAVVTLIDASTGQPALVYGIDGFSVFPASMVTGTSVTDESGYVYELREGEFRFPVMPEGEYYISVVTPEGFTFSSVYQPEQLIDLPNGPFDVEQGDSYGETFVQTVPGPLHFDVPLDPKTDIVLSKSANPSFGDIGDFIRYTVSVQNTGRVSAPMRVRDIAPTGFRYLRGSSTIGAVKITDPEVSDNGRVLTYLLPVLAAGESYELHYIMQIGADAKPGEHINSAVALDADGAETSNIARVGVTLREELLRSTNTIIGRVAEYACDGDEEWSREILDGTGVPRVRLYMETGAYTVTDDDGLFHFEGITPGTHVVQVDEETLPKGYAAMTCEDNSQYARLKTSKFLDNKGGGIWRANFYLQRVGDVEEEAAAEKFDDVVEYKAFGDEWLNTQSADIDWVYPQKGKTPSAPSVNIGIKHGPSHTVSMQLNGSPVSMLNFQARDSNKDRSVMISRWRGVDVLNGQNVFIATVKNEDGRVVKTTRREIFFIRDIARATPAPDQSVLVADGRTNPVIAVRIEDEAGRPVHSGRKLTVDVLDPYRLEVSGRMEATNELVAPLASRADASVGANGIAYIRLQPTLQTGKATVIVTLDDGRKIDVSMYLKPEKRDWIVVGLAEGSAGFENLKDNGVDLNDDSDVLTDGRLAFFAKGLIKGEWLMTLAVDTDKRRGKRDGDLFEQIDPNAYYTLYGDRTYEGHEAESRYPVYLKLERNTVYAMFGNYNTNMTEGVLTRYSRRLSGLKAEYTGERFDVMGFAAETNQGFAKDEIAANGTSGPYRTEYAPVLANSEIIEIETRDRFRADNILETRTLKRHLDYTIDYLTGEIIFRLPIDVTDPQFNPNVIVVDYETSQDAERNLTYGGRAAVKLADERVVIGASYIHEEGNADRPGAAQDVLGVDVVANLTENTQVRAEYARSSDNGETPDARAYLAEIIHTSGKLAAEAYFREDEAGFGVGQQGSNTLGVRRTGVNASYKISEEIQEDTGRRRLRNIEGQTYQEESLETGAKRRLSEITLTQDSDTFGGAVGLRQVKDEVPGLETRESLLAIASVRATLPEHGLTASIAHEQPIGGKDESDAFPQRTTLGLDKTITTKATVSLRHELLQGQNVEGENTTIGVSYAPFAGTDITAQTDLLTSDSARRLGATVGVDQQFKINNNWSLSTGLSQRQILESSGAAVEIAPDAAISPIEANEDYISGYLGLGYRTAVTSVSARAEARFSDTGETLIGTAGAARELSERFSVAAAARAQVQEIDGTPLAPESLKDTRADVRIGAAWRPRGEGLVVFDRFDVKYEDLANGVKTKKLVNNMAMNTMIGDRTQVTGYWGLKKVETTIGGESYDSTANLLGGEVRYDITERVDIGVHGQMISTGDTKSYAYGPSIGWSPVENTWISVGYNVDGYDDDDFEAAEYSQDGAYVKLRIKFDQDTTRSLLRRISPSGE